ncbi:hypothetical protein GDO86_017984 [Hymenochirus boettgeri]|uniref:Uncharacterized protein n=1 Tax=Hymenochirus boettgeri TaxID=247094 RepID=A0A8T2IEN8_9PIPI|nr:hypothetical protein GDO86_017984 [Hymenochirus boettgeri]
MAGTFQFYIKHDHRSATRISGPWIENKVPRKIFEVSVPLRRFYHPEQATKGADEYTEDKRPSPSQTNASRTSDEGTPAGEGNKESEPKRNKCFKGKFTPEMKCFIYVNHPPTTRHFLLPPLNCPLWM